MLDREEMFAGPLTFLLDLEVPTARIRYLVAGSHPARLPSIGAVYRRTSVLSSPALLQGRSGLILRLPDLPQRSAFVQW